MREATSGDEVTKRRRTIVELGPLFLCQLQLRRGIKGQIWLVVWNMTFIFPYVENVMFPSCPNSVGQLAIEDCVPSNRPGTRTQDDQG